MVKHILRSLLINAVALFLTSHYISGFHLNNIIIVTLAFTLLDLLAGPILKVFLGALNFITFGLVGLAVDVLMLYILSTYLGQMSFSSWTFPGFTYAGVIIPSYGFTMLITMAICALAINLIRSVLKYLAS